MSCARDPRLSRSRKREITQLNFLVVFRARLPLSPPTTALVHGHSSPRFFPTHRENFVQMETSLPTAPHENPSVEIRVSLSLSLSLSRGRKVSNVSPIVNRTIFRLKVTGRTEQGWLLIYRSFLLGKRNSERTCPKPETSTPSYRAESLLRGFVYRLNLAVTISWSRFKCFPWYLAMEGNRGKRRRCTAFSQALKTF